MPVNDHDELAPGMPDPDVPRSAGKSLRVVEDSQIGLRLGQRLSEFPGPIRGAAVHDQDLEAVGRVVLGNELPDRALDEPGLIPHRNHHRHERETTARGGPGEWIGADLGPATVTGNRETSWLHHVLVTVG